MISILLPFKDAAATLTSCLSSIAAQNFSHFEVVAVDDHSTDGSASLVANFPDARIRCIKNPGSGLVDALNWGLKISRFNLVARMDADDLMRPTRLNEQYLHFQRNPDLVLSATRARLFSSDPIQSGYQAYMHWQNNIISVDDIHQQIFVESPFAHPSVMFRRDKIRDLGGYRKGLFPEDYDLWLRLAQASMPMEKLSQVLVDWREYPHRTSRTSPCYLREAFDQLRATYLIDDPRLRNNRPIVIWGAGRKTRKRAQHLIDQGIQVTAWIDIDPKKIGNIVGGARIHSPNWLRLNNKIASEKPLVLIYVANHGAREEIAQFLESIKYRPNEDFIPIG